MHRLALLIAICMLPAVILGILLLGLVPHIPFWPYFLLITSVVDGGVYYLIWRSKEQHNSVGTSPGPDSIYRKKGYHAVFLLMTPIGAMASYSFNKTFLYLDNGSAHEIVFLVNGQTDTVAAGGFLKVKVVIGDNKVSYNGKTRLLHVTSHGSWVFNADTLNDYEVLDIKYSGQQTLLYYGQQVPNDSSQYLFTEKIVHQEFFSTNADYLFEAPESINLSSRRAGKRVTNKKILLHILRGKPVQRQDTLRVH